MLKVPYVTGYLSEHFGDDDFGTLEGYEAKGGYSAARKAACDLAPGDLIELVKDAGLQGRGGAGFSTGMKWSFMPEGDDRPKYLVCNADESEPGSFKDRILIERGAHQMLDGILCAAKATGAEKTFVYIRGEYAEPARRLQRAIDEAYAKGYLGDDVMGSGMKRDVVLQRGAGADICGAETGQLESREGKKGQ
ncbi:MAG: NADH-quinone oxidoreductase subunit F, partial [Myxococcota bacterium]